MGTVAAPMPVKVPLIKTILAICKYGWLQGMNIESA